MDGLDGVGGKDEGLVWNGIYQKSIRWDGL